MADANQDVWQWIATGAIALLSSMGLYKITKIDDIPEKYVLKTDCQQDKFVRKEDFHQVRLEIREDIRNSEAKLLDAINRIHDRIYKRREEVRNGG